MAEPSPKEEPPPTNFLCKLLSFKIPFQMPTCSSIVDTMLRENLGILSPKEIYIPGPEHDNCTLQPDKYYTQGKQKSKEKDRKKSEKDGHGAHAHCVGEEGASHSHIPTNRGHTHIHEEGHSHGENLQNPMDSPLGRSDQHGCSEISRAHCCRSGPPSSPEEIHSSHENYRGCLNKNCVSVPITHDSSKGGASNHSNVDFCPRHDEHRSRGCLPEKKASHDCHREASSIDALKKCTEDHDCGASGSHSHELRDKTPWKSPEGDCSTLHSSLKLGPSRSSLKDCDSAASSSRDSSKNIRHECCHTGSNLHEPVGRTFTHSYQTNGHIHDHTHDPKHCAPHAHFNKPQKHPRVPPSKAEYLFGTLVPPPPTYSSPSTSVPEYLVYKPEPPQKAFVSPAGIGPIKWNRPENTTTNQAPTKQAGSGKIGAPEAQRSQAGLPRGEAENRQSDARLPRPTHILPPTLNSSPGFSGFLWHDESGFLDKKVLEEHYKKSQVLNQLVPDGYVQSPNTPSKVGKNGEREETPVGPSVAALETEDLNSTWESFEFLLTDYRMVCLVDDSLFMAGHPWLLASEIVPQIALLSAKYSGAEGADIRFVNNLSGKTDQVGLDPRDVRTTEKARNLFPRTPEGKKNPMGLELNKILSPYVRRWKQHGFNEEKPVDVIILTASSPSDYNFCVKSVVDITKELDKLGAPPAQICIQFFQISKVPAVTDDLRKLSEELMRKCTGRKIVRTFLWNEQVEAQAWSAQVVLDCVRKVVEQKIFAAPTKSIAGNKVPSCKCCT